jgi:hypothetical protein
VYGAFFRGYRRARERHYADRDPKAGASKKRALITMVHDEPIFLPIWLRYYSRFFGEDDIYVFDHDTTDGSTDRDGFVRIPVSHFGVDHVWMVDTIQGLQHELLAGAYDVVLVTDVDEIILPDPAWGTLGDYIDRLDEEFVTCRGFELIHVKDVEAPLRLDEPILDQRGHWFENTGYAKTLLSMVPMDWKPGFHMRTDERVNCDPDFYLVHLHRMDYELCRARHEIRRTMAWGDRDVADDWAAHNRITEDREFERWFYEDSSFPDQPIVVEPMPAHWRGAF